MKLRYLLWLCTALELNAATGVTISASQQLNDGLDSYRRGQFRQAHTLLGPLAENGEAQAQFTLAMMYSSGRGVELDESRAAQWLKLAAAQGHRDSEYWLAQITEQGWGVPLSREQAIHWYQRCAAQSDQRCQARLEQLNIRRQEITKPESTRPPATIIATDSKPAELSAPTSTATNTATPAPQTPDPQLAPTSVTPEQKLRGEDWIRAQNPAHYTIQIMTAPNEQEIYNYARQYELTGDVAIARELRRGKIWYSLIYGSYESSKATNKARNTLSPKISKSGSWARRFRELQVVIQDKSAQ